MEYKTMKYTIKIWLKIVGALLIIVAFFVIWWSVRLQEHYAREEFLLEDYSGESFEAPFKEIHGIALCNDDVKSYDFLEENQISLQISILDDNGEKIWVWKNDSIKLSSFAITDYIGMEGLPIILETGRKYSIVCESPDVLLEHLTIGILGKEVNYEKHWTIACILSVTIAIGGYLWLHFIDKKRSLLLFFAMYMLMGILYNIIIAPYSVQDENTHFAQAYGISNMILGKERADENGYIYVEESGLKRINRCDSGQDLYRFYYNWDYGNLKQENGISEIYRRDTSIPEFVYYFPALGITIARLLNCPYQIIVLAGRFTNLLLCTSLITLALALNKAFRKSMAAIAFFPSSIWIISSLSYDGWNLAFCMLIFSYCIYLREREKLTSLKEILIFLLLCVLMVPIKFIYYFFVLCILWVPVRRFKNIRRDFIMVCGAGLISAFVAFKARGASALSYLLTTNVDARSIVEDREPYTLFWVLQNPIRTIKIYLNTLFEQGENYIFKCVSGDFAGTPVPEILVYLLLFVVIILMLSEADINYIRRRDRVLAGCILVLGIGVIMTTFLFVYSYIYLYSIGTIAGIQGRYFLPLFLFLPLLIGGKWRIEEKTKRVILYGILLLNLWIALCKLSGLIQTGI